ncbi:HEPN domain-containing protein [Methanogenium sp. MK-MG]|uniref:HEPN domain-containing protein n=1 Tax=Methanogenium sp. MK-MG TaxID=2599926 RepID=UPI001C20A4CF|nr:HEPN domain-containing protein [Methanogenium sp. MK-MG]KAF1078034.1 hypothetical protein MKMG_01076 [Methanogenium sp. MK-MG]
MSAIDDCFRKNLLRRVPPSKKKAEDSLTLAESYLEESKKTAAAGARKISINGAYLVWFHAARAVLFRDGIREKSHYCIERYLEKYVTTGHLEEQWVTLFSRMRTQRHENQYGFGPDPTAEEVASAIEYGARFLARIRVLLADTT